LIQLYQTLLANQILPDQIARTSELIEIVIWNFFPEPQTNEL
jgi:hypothetical protein